MDFKDVAEILITPYQRVIHNQRPEQAGMAGKCGFQCEENLLFLPRQHLSVKKKKKEITHTYSEDFKTEHLSANNTH